MNTLEIYTIKRSDGIFRSSFACRDESGEVVKGIQDTLLDFITVLNGTSASQFQSDLNAGFSQLTTDFDAPDWEINDMCVWIGREPTKKGMVCMTNENTEFSIEIGNQQEFPIPIVLFVLNYWRSYQEQVAKYGLEKMAENVLRCQLPDF